MVNDPSKPAFGRQNRKGEFSDLFENENSMEPTYTRDTFINGSPNEIDEKLEAAKRSRKARGTLVRFFNFLFTIAIVGAICFVGLIWYGTTQFEAKGPLQEAKTFVVPKGASFRSIQAALEAEGIIEKQGPLRVFIRGVQAAGQDSKLKAGEFAMKPGMSMRQVMHELTEGRSVEYSITFPEGWTSYQISERIAFDETLEGDRPEIPPEGSLLPSTYSFPRGTTRQQVIERLQEAQKKAVDEVWKSRVVGLPLKSPEEMVILASIVEKETGVAGERAHVASVFVNRLRKGMKLETDPTIIYGLFGGKGKPKDRPIFRSDIRRSTPYNTYIIKGLPPTPIANPGIESLRAVANPLETEDLFFVADGSGGHAFAKTLKEHNANVAKWRKIEAAAKKAREAAEKAAKEAEENGDETSSGGADN